MMQAAINQQMQAAQDEAQALLRQRHHLQAGEDDDFSIRNMQEIFAAQESSSRVMSMMLAAIASVSLIVGGIGIMNIMLVSVRERTREIGLRQAVGAKTRDILTQFLVEAATLSLAGGIVGIVVGVGASFIVSRLANWQTVIGPARCCWPSSFPAWLALALATIRQGKPHIWIPLRRYVTNERGGLF